MSYFRKELTGMADTEFYNFMLAWFEVMMRCGLVEQSPGTNYLSVCASEYVYIPVYLYVHPYTYMMFIHEHSFMLYKLNETC